MKFLKIFLLTCNSIFLLTGITITSFGCYITFITLAAYADFLSANEGAKALSLSGYIITATGLIIILVYCLGCCGVYSENACMLYSFSISLGFLLLAKVIFGSLVLSFSSHVTQQLRDALHDSLKRYNLTDHQLHTNKWDDIQTRFQCCGINNYTDWENSRFYNQTGNMVPDSCCGGTCDHGMIGVSNTNNTIYKKGCLETFGQFFERNIVWIGTLEIVVMIIQFVIIISACYFGKKSNTRRDWYSMFQMNQTRYRYRDSSFLNYVHQRII